MGIVKELKEVIAEKGGHVPAGNSVAECVDYLGECLGDADWNAAEGEPGHVLNRPFYSETTEIVVENVREAQLEGFPVFVVGDTVTVKVDGIEYNLVAYDDEGCATLGDHYTDLESGTGSMGWQIYMEYDNNCYFCATGAHSVSYLGERPHQIDKKYIPDYNALVFNLNALVGEYSLVSNLSNDATVYSVSPNINFATLPGLTFCDFGNIGLAEKHSTGPYFVSFRYTRLISASQTDLVLVHSDTVDQGVAEYKEAYGIE